MNPLELCTNPPAMAALLQRSLPGFAGERARIESLRVHKTRRSSSIACNPHPIALDYELAVRDGRRVGSLRLYAKMFRGGASAQCFASIDPARLERPAWGDPVVHVPALDMVLWALPNDPGLPQLAALLDPLRLGALLPWDALGIDPARVRDLGVELLRYEPEQRATLRCTLAVDGAAQPLVLYAKTFVDSRGRAIYERFDHDQVWLHEGRVVLFDFDEFTLGDPMEDVAAFATRLDDVGHGHAFITAFAARSGVGFDHRLLQWHLALQALLQASRAFVFQRPAWRAELERWLARAEACVAEPVPPRSLRPEGGGPTWERPGVGSVPPSSLRLLPPEGAGPAWERSGDGPAREESFA